jgi:hypothetical protein
MITAARALKRRIAPSLRMATAGESDEAVPICGRPCGKRCPTNQMTRFTANARQAKIDTKMSTRQPARMPVGPRKILVAVGD